MDENVGERASAADFLNVFAQKANYVRYSVYTATSSHLSVCMSPERCILGTYPKFTVLLYVKETVFSAE